MFAPAHHGATRYVVPVRKELAVRTIFNFLGPLTNPAGATRQVIGVSDPAFLRDDRRARWPRLGADRALVVSSEDGLDEMSTAGTTTVVEVDGDRDRSATRSLRRTSACAAARSRPSPAARPQHNAARDAPDPRRRGRPARATWRCSTPAPRSTSAGARRRRSRRGVRAAEQAIDSGAAAEALDTLVALTQRAGRRRERARADRRRRRARSSSARREPTPLAQLEAALDRGPESRPFSEALAAPGISRDRRAQAPLAVGRA